MGWYYGFKPYVPVAQRRAQAAREIAKRTRKGQTVSPVRIEGRAITSTFWGKAWCVNLESYSDYANRLPRGRTYVRNGSVVDLKIEKGRIKALVSGSELYEIRIDIAALPKQHWQALKGQCAGQIGSLVELLQGKLSKSVMELVTDRERGLFPKPKEIEMRCSCPDYAGLCKHLAAVMYGIGNRLDSSPEVLFLLRGVDHTELIEQAIPAAPLGTDRGAPTIPTDELGAIFDIEIGDAPVVTAGTTSDEKPPAKKASKKTGNAKKPSVAKKTKTKSLPRKG
ncbi:MAG: SWIM zinc finger family protein [Zavarzinella sp.]|nr:SWIM zinc finger family protein [Zavarzinella sp.]